MAIDQELGIVIQDAETRRTEDRGIVPVSAAQRRFCKIVSDAEPDETRREQIVASFLPVVEWLTRPRFIDEFQELKKSLMDLGYERPPSRPQRKLWEDTNGNIDFVDGVLSIADEFKMLLKGYVDQEVGSVGQEKRPPVEYVWSRVEGDILSQSPKVNTYNSFEELVKALDEGRTKSYYKLADTARQGLLLGDFRVGDHKSHGLTIERAKLAVGRHGKLAVITPSRKTILNTTSKDDAWDDDNRIYRLAGNRYIDDLWLADMPEQYYKNPEAYWAEIYRKIHPDLVFVGERDHPLQSTFERFASNFGGILLIDPEPIGTRSGDLLKIK